MKNVSLTYYGGEDQKFFEYQEIIYEDIKRIMLFISDFNESKERNALLTRLDMIIDSIKLNRFERKFASLTDLPEESKIIVNISDKYLIFDYYDINDIKEQKFLFLPPIRVIISRNMKEYFFLIENEIYYIDYFSINGSEITENFIRTYSLDYHFENESEYVKSLKQKII